MTDSGSDETSESTDVDSASSGTSSSTGGSTSSDTSGDGDTSGDTSGETSGETEDTSGETTGSPQLDCWDKDPNVWMITEINSPGLGDNPREPGMSSDGLTLWYSADTPNGNRPFMATRDSLMDSFETGSQLAAWPGYELSFDKPRSIGEHELVLAGDGDLWTTVRVGNTWSEPTVLDISVPWADPDAPSWHPDNVVTNESLGSVTDDGALLVFTRQSGPTNVALDGPINRILTATRPPFSAPGTAFGSLDEPALPTELTEYPYPLYCPTVSPDGVHMLFASTFPFPVPDDPDAWIDKLVIQYVQRASLDADWDDGVQTLSSLSVESWQACPAAITHDGCQLVFTRNLMAEVLPDEEDRYRIYLATR